MRAFADALDCVPMALAENSGLSPIETLANIKSRQAKENNSRLGVDCMQTGSNGEFEFNFARTQARHMPCSFDPSNSSWATQHMISILFGRFTPERAFARLSHVVSRCVSRSFSTPLRISPRYISACVFAHSQPAA
jgi:hypothetical protein